MNTHSIRPHHPGGRHTACRAAIAMALLGLVPVVSIADQGDTIKSDSRVADVPLSDLNLSAPEGMREAHNRLHAMAERLCADRSGGRKSSSQPVFATCVDSTVANALRGIDALRKTDLKARSSVTLGANVSLGDLDLSTLEGERLARQRLEAMARRLCSELGRRDLPYQSDRTECVHDTLAGAWAQANAIRAANERRTAQRTR